MALYSTTHAVYRLICLFDYPAYYQRRISDEFKVRSIPSIATELILRRNQFHRYEERYFSLFRNTFMPLLPIEHCDFVESPSNFSTDFPLNKQDNFRIRICQVEFFVVSFYDRVNPNNIWEKCYLIEFGGGGGILSHSFKKKLN